MVLGEVLGPKKRQLLETKIGPGDSRHWSGSRCPLCPADKTGTQANGLQRSMGGATGPT